MIDDNAALANFAMASLISERRSDGTVAWHLRVLAILSNNYAASSILVTDLDQNRQADLVFSDFTNAPAIRTIESGCSGATVMPCPWNRLSLNVPVIATLFERGYLNTDIGRATDYVYDHLSAASIVSGTQDIVVLRNLKTGSVRDVTYFVLRRNRASDRNYDVLKWNCPWEPSPLDGREANSICVSYSNPLASIEHLKILKAVVLSPANCSSGDCAPVINAYLRSSAIRSVVLTAGRFVARGAINVTTLNTKGETNSPGKRLIGAGMGKTILISKSRYYNYLGPDRSPAVINAVDEPFDNCRNFGTMRQPDGSLKPETSFKALQKVRNNCGAILTEGSNIEIKGLTIDTAEWKGFMNRLTIEGKKPTYIVAGIIIGRRAHNMAYGQVVQAYPQITANRRVDTSRAPEDRIHIEDIDIANMAQLGIASFQVHGF